MQLYAKKVSAIASGDYYQVHLDSEECDDEQLEPFEQPAPYLLVQSQFEFFDGGKCYIESAPCANMTWDTYPSEIRV